MNPLVLLAAVILLLLYLYRKATDRPHNFPPGPPSLPIYGAYWLLLLNNYKFIHKAMHNMAVRYRTKVVGFYLGSFPTVVACDYDSIREVLLKPEFQGRLDTFVIRERQLRKLIGVFFVDGDYWKYQRRFMLRHLRDFGFDCRNEKQESLVQQQIQDIVEVMRGRKEDKEVFRDGYALIPDIFSHIFINTLWDMFCGDSLTHEIHLLSRYMARQGFKFQRHTDPTGGALSLTPWIRHFAPRKSGYVGMQEANNHMLESLQKSIDEHLQTYSEDHMRDFIDIFIREMKEQESTVTDQSPFTVEQLLIVGLDLVLPTLTTATATLGFAIQFLLRHPEVQKKVQKELDSVVGRDRLPTLNDRPNLPYTEATLREVMRRKTILPLGVAHKALEDGHIGGYFVPKGAMVVASMYSFNRDPKVWGDPKAFRPERFISEDGKRIKDISLPFGAGKRLCAGETFSRNNMFLILSGLLQNFSFVVPKGGKLPNLRPIPGLMLSPEEFWVKVEVRD